MQRLHISVPLAALLILVLFAAAGLISGCNGEFRLLTDRDEVVEYSVASTSEEEINGAHKLVYQVVIEEEASVEQMRETSKAVVNEAIAGEDKFNAITLHLYDRKEFTRGAFTLGRVRFTKDGDIDRAVDIEAGDYRNMDFEWQLMHKDWSRQPSSQTVSIYVAWYEVHDEVKEALEKGEDVPEHLVTEDGERVDHHAVDEKIAEEFGISVQRVNEVFQQITDWRLMNVQTGP